MVTNVFIRKAGAGPISIEEALSRKLTNYFGAKDFLEKHISMELQCELKPKYCLTIPQDAPLQGLKEGLYPYISYRVKVTDLSNVLEAGKILIDSFWEDVQSNDLVVVREFPTVDRSDIKDNIFYIGFRAVCISRE